MFKSSVLRVNRQFLAVARNTACKRRQRLTCHNFKQMCNEFASRDCTLEFYNSPLVEPFKIPTEIVYSLRMDITSLPNEMLSSVLKYMNFGHLLMLRKQNQRINSLAKRNKLCERVPVIAFMYYRESGTCKILLYLEGTDYKFYDDNSCVFTLQPNTDFPTVLNFYLPKIKIKGCFSVDHVNIDEQVISVLHQHKESLNRADIMNIAKSRFNIGKDLVKRFYGEIFPNTASISLNGGDCQEIFNSEVLADRKWKLLRMFENNPDVRYVLDDNFLTKVVINCKEVFIHSQNISTFTQLGVQQLLKDCIAADGTFNRDFYLGLVYGLNVSLDNLQEIFDKIIEDGLKEKKDRREPLKCKLDVVHKGNLPRCKFTFGDGIDVPHLWFYYAAKMFPP